MDVDSVDVNDLNAGQLDELRTALKTRHTDLQKRQTDLDKIHNDLLRFQAQLEGREQQITSQAQNAPLTATLAKLGGSIDIQNVGSMVQTFTGKPKELNGWLKSIEKLVTLTHGKLDDETCGKVAYRSCKGAVSDFLHQYIKDNPSATWDTIKTELKDRFGEHLDPQARVVKLRALRQKPEQGLQVFAEVLLSKSREIYDEDQLSHILIQRELVSIFCKGMKDGHIARKVIRKNPKSLAEAVNLSTKETECESRLEAYGLRQEEPMEVDRVKGRYQYAQSSPRGPRAQVNALQDQGKYYTKPHPKQPNKWLDGRPVCNNCGVVGHVFRNCRRKRLN